MKYLIMAIFLMLVTKSAVAIDCVKSCTYEAHPHSKQQGYCRVEWSSGSRLEVLNAMVPHIAKI